LKKNRNCPGKPGQFLPGAKKEITPAWDKVGVINLRKGGNQQERRETPCELYYEFFNFLSRVIFEHWLLFKHGAFLSQADVLKSLHSFLT
jgi:hypothetical protein